MKNAEIISLYVVQGSDWVSKKQRYENTEHRRKAFIKISLAYKPLRDLAFSSLPPHCRGFFMSALYQLEPGLIANRMILRKDAF